MSFIEGFLASPGDCALELEVLIAGFDTGLLLLDRAGIPVADGVLQAQQLLQDVGPCLRECFLAVYVDSLAFSLSNSYCNLLCVSQVAADALNLPTRVLRHGERCGVAL
ncbi:MAG TPA: hypothetical protein PKV86_09955, partial [Syntrophobacteraceae bacterium]|nr:hypothetical protein [Syntrophobacteraceae bacterium]